MHHDHPQACRLWSATVDRCGRTPILLLGFAILPLRAALYTLSDDSAWLIGAQLLNGAGAGIFGAITPLAFSDGAECEPIRYSQRG